MAIEKLTDDLARKIAAGEVIERPASVVKELVENAIDAKSERIDVELAEGGKTGIVVRDDGLGMDPSDLDLCVARHATSKIHHEADLDAIHTLGFRGEALASIAAVSKMRIVSRAEPEEAHRLEVEAGVAQPVRIDSRATGTTVEVRDLFFNLPARARFLGTSRTELLHSSRAVQRYALVEEGIGWTLRHGDREIFSAPRCGSLLDRIGQIYSVEVAHAMLSVEGRLGDIRIRGYVSRPDMRRGSRKDQLFVVNGRAVADRGLSYVLASAFRGILRPGSYPMAVLHIDLPPEQVDVNVHPRKEEVRFGQPRQVQDALSAALLQALSKRAAVAPLPARDPGSTAARPAPSGVTRGSTTSYGSALPFNLQTAMTASQAEKEAEKVRGRDDLRVIGQLQSTYLLVETAEGLDIIDQHIAHERVLYERLQKQLGSEGISRQMFLLPARVEVPFETAAVLSQHLALLEEVGVVLEAFGGGTFLLREYPRMLAEEQTRRGFQELIEALADALREGADVKTALFDRVLRELSCAGAIKAGDRIPLAEAQALVEQLLTLDNPNFCPHGRPIIRSLSREELDRQFKRT